MSRKDVLWYKDSAMTCQLSDLACRYQVSLAGVAHVARPEEQIDRLVLSQEVERNLVAALQQSPDACCDQQLGWRVRVDDIQQAA